MAEKAIDEVKSFGLENALKRKRTLLASVDTHVYGVHYTKVVLESAGAEIVDAGVEPSVAYLFDIAEEAIRYIGISTHNGQALGIAEQILTELDKRDEKYVLFLGGVLNTILPGHSEPSDVKDMINKKGIFADNDLIKTIQMLQKEE